MQNRFKVRFIALILAGTTLATGATAVISCFKTAMAPCSSLIVSGPAPRIDFNCHGHDCSDALAVDPLVNVAELVGNGEPGSFHDLTESPCSCTWRVAACATSGKCIFPSAITGAGTGTSSTASGDSCAN